MQETRMYTGSGLEYTTAADEARRSFQAEAEWMLTDRQMIVHSWQMTSVCEKGILQVIIIALYIPNYYGGGRS